MFRNYFRTAVRNLRRNRVYAAINVAGLAVGIAACLLIFLVIRFENSFDNFHADAGHIYRIGTRFDKPEGASFARGICFPAAKQLQLDYPQFKKVTSIYQWDNTQVTVMDASGNPTDRKFKEDNIFLTRPSFFEIFHFPMITGTPGSLSAPYTSILSKSAAVKYFGDWRRAVGHDLRFNDKKICRVTGVMEDAPVNTDLPLDIVVSMGTSRQDSSKDWVSTYGSLSTFVVAPAGMTQSGLDGLLRSFTKKHKPADYQTDVFVAQPLKEMHFDERFGTYRHRTFSHSLVSALLLIGLFLLVIACINFINLATAQAINRAREVGVRKVMGSGKRQLILQFLSESFIITLFSIVLAAGLAFTALPFLNKLLDTSITLYPDVSLIGFIVIAVISVTLLSGLYPALVLSGFNPITALRSRLTATKSGISLRRALVVFQFVIAQALIIGTVVIIYQMDFFRNASMGFTKESIVNADIPPDSISQLKYQSFKNRLLALNGVTHVSFSDFTIASNNHWNSDFRFDNSPKKTEFGADLKWSDADVFKTFDLKFIAGRAFFPSDTVREFVVNEALARRLGFKDPSQIIGKKINMWDGQIVAPVVGVVKDFNSQSLAGPIEPAIIAPWKNTYVNVAVRMQPQQTRSVLTALERIWNETFPDKIYNYQFLDATIADFYRQEAQLAQLYKVFAAIAIFISCLGLYGLISFMALQRTKEVGIRKTLGASAANIVYLFSKEFTLLIGIAFLVAAPLAWYFMHRWLENYTFRIQIGAGIFAITIFASILIAWLTVGYQALKAALANPIKSLRTE